VSSSERIVRLQIQRVPIKVKSIGYLPDEILAVSRASVDAWGMLGWHGGAWVVDAHNRAHPSRRGGGRRPLSIGFTGHHAAMEERFGDAPTGIEDALADLHDGRRGFIVAADRASTPVELTLGSSVYVSP
jgi:hypothetical protein